MYMHKQATRAVLIRISSLPLLSLATNTHPHILLFISQLIYLEYSFLSTAHTLYIHPLNFNSGVTSDRMLLWTKCVSLKFIR